LHYVYIYVVLYISSIQPLHDVFIDLYLLEIEK